MPVDSKFPGPFPYPSPGLFSDCGIFYNIDKITPIFVVTVGVVEDTFYKVLHFIICRKKTLRFHVSLNFIKTRV